VGIRTKERTGKKTNNRRVRLGQQSSRLVRKIGEVLMPLGRVRFGKKQ